MMMMTLQKQEKSYKMSMVRIFKGADQISEYKMTDIPCGIIGFYVENNEKKSAVLAIGAGSNVLIYKNLRPHFKFCLPQSSVHPKEKDIWYRISLDEDLNISTFTYDLQLLSKEIGAVHLSSRSRKFLSLDSKQQLSFAEKYRKLPLYVINVITVIHNVRKDSWSEMSSSYIILGTEEGEILVLDQRAFFVINKYTIGWPPVAIASCGLWNDDGQIIVTGRTGKIGAIKRSSIFKFWETLSSPAITLASTRSEGAAVITMDGFFLAFSKPGVKLWIIKLPGNPLDMVCLSIIQRDLFLIAISIAGFGVRIYDQKRHVDTINTLESVSSLKFGQLGQEEHAMALVTCSGGLCIKILKRTADFSTCSDLQENSNLLNNCIKFIIPKRTKLFIEQTIRERMKAAGIHVTFQQGFQRLRLKVAVENKNIVKVKHIYESSTITLQSLVFGLGPTYIVKILITNVSETTLNNNFFLLCRIKDSFVFPRITKVPLLSPSITLPKILLVVPEDKIINQMQILLCSKGEINPLISTTVILPLSEEDVEI